MTSNSKDIRAGAAYVEMYIRDNLTKPLNDMGKKLQQWGANVASAGAKIFAAGAAATGVMLGAVRHFAESGAQLARVSQQIGVSVEALSELRYAAQQAGLSFEDLQALFKGTDNFLQQIRSGSAEAYQALGQLGISVTELQGKSPDQVMERIADGLARIPDPTLRASRAMQIFGEAGLKALPMFAQGAAGIQRMRQEARALGLQVSTRDANAALALSQAWTRVWATVQAAVFAIGGALAPVLKSVLDGVQGFVSGVVGWIQKNQELARTIFIAVLAVTAIGAGLVALGAAMTIAGMALSGLALGIAAVAAVVSFVLSPLGLLVAGVVALAYVSGALTTIGNAFKSMMGGVIEVVGAVVSALSSGRFELAGKIIYATLALAWERVKNFMVEGWYVITDTIMSIWDNVADSVAKGMIGAWHSIQTVWYNGIWALGRLIDSTLGTNLTTQAEASLARMRSQWTQELQQIDDMRNARAGERDRAGQQRALGSMNREADLSRALNELVALTRSSSGRGESNIWTPDVPQQMASSLYEAVRIAQPMGTFNAFAVGGMSPQDRVQMRIAEAAVETMELQRRAVEFLQDMAEGLTYG